jgi:hypothetical protein
VVNAAIDMGVTLFAAADDLPQARSKRIDTECYNPSCG